MTVSEATRRVLSLAFTESLAGEAIPESCNGQADLIRAVPSLLGSALSMTVSACGGLPAACPILALPPCKKPPLCPFSGSLVQRELSAQLTEGLSPRLRLLPPDCIRPVAIRSADGSRRFPATGLPGTIEIPEGLEEGTLEYRRRAVLPALDADPAEELDGSPEMQNAALLWAASQLLLAEDPYRAAFLNRQYESALGRLPSILQVSTGITEDVYCFPVSVY